MDKALSVLDELGATDQAGKLTALGRHMVRLHIYTYRGEPDLFTDDSRSFRLTYG
jgi:HrpA-like RNA helicase